MIFELVLLNNEIVHIKILRNSEFFLSAKSQISRCDFQFYFVNVNYSAKSSKTWAVRNLGKILFNQILNNRNALIAQLRVNEWTRACTLSRLTIRIPEYVTQDLTPRKTLTHANPISRIFATVVHRNLTNFQKLR